MRQRTLSLGWVALLSISSVQAQTTGVWNKAFSEASAKSFANAHGYAGVGFSPAIMSIPDKPFTAKRLYSNQRKENVVDVGPPHHRGMHYRARYPGTSALRDGI